MVLLNGVAVSVPMFVALIGTATILAILAAIAGTGGGSLFLPLFSLPLSDVHFAVPLSKTAVLGTAIGACFVNYAYKTSSGDLINYRLVTLIQPATLLGCTCGVLLNLWFPSPLITSLMILILGFTAYKTFEHAQKIDQSEANDRQRIIRGSRLENLAFASISDTEPLIKAGKDEVIRADLNSVESLEPFLSAISAVASPRMQISTQVSSASPSSASPDRIKNLLDLEDSKMYASRSILLEPSGFLLNEVLLTMLSWAVNLICLVFAGSPAAIVCGTWDQQAWILIEICFLISFVGYNYLRLSKSLEIEAQRLEQPKQRWLSPKTALIYTSLSYLAGVGAALLGIGGGLIKSPLLIAIGVQPVSAVATSNFMILFTASTNVIIYSIAGRLNLLDAFYFTPLTFIGGVVGMIYLRRFFASNATQSRLARVLGSTIVLGAGVMILSSVLNQYIRGVSDERTMTQACITLHRKQTLWSRIRALL